MPTPNKDFLLSEILREISDMIARGDSARIRKLHAMLFNEPKLFNSDLSSSRTKKPRAAIPPVGLEELRKSIDSYQSRDELDRYLRENLESKSKIISAAKTLKIMAARTDTYDAIVDKIIDATVGYKLRSRAIRGSTQLNSSETAAPDSSTTE